MRRTLFAPLILALMLVACQITAPGAPSGLADDAIAVTPLDGAAAPVEAGAVVAKPGTPHPKPRPADLATAPAEAVPAEPAPVATPTEPDVPKTPEQMLCEKSKGQWVAAGDTGAFYCASMTRDGGKQCTRKTQCEGQCLARSGTCSPITPLYGCNDIFEKDGRQVTLCID